MYGRIRLLLSLIYYSSPSNPQLLHRNTSPVRRVCSRSPHFDALETVEEPRAFQCVSNTSPSSPTYTRQTPSSWKRSTRLRTSASCAVIPALGAPAVETADALARPPLIGGTGSGRSPRWSRRIGRTGCDPRRGAISRL